MSRPSATLQNRRGVYFFLSYAHSAPDSQGTLADPDRWVKAFYGDLHEEVRRLARPNAELDIGFYDQLLPPGSDWKELLAAKLGAAEVFVPLYSPGYFKRSWPMWERDSFGQRVADSEPTLVSHVVPVLWLPIPLWDRRPELEQALELARNTPAYAANGMRALCALRSYRRQYLTVLDLLARRIVAVAEGSPLGASEPLALGDPPMPEPDQSDTPFAVMVLAARNTDLPPGRRGDAYGDRATAWRPFADPHAVPVAEYTANVAEQLGLPTRTIDVLSGGEVPSGSPGLLLIDPWIVSSPEGVAALQAAVRQLPKWVTPLVIADQSDLQYAPDQAAKVTATVAQTLARAGVREQRRVRDLEEFEELMPMLVAEARRNYLRHAQVYPPPGPTIKRPRITGQEPGSIPQPRKKTDD
jgi:FxsC-like protein